MAGAIVEDSENWFLDVDYPLLKEAMAEIGNLLIDSINDRVELEDFNERLPALDKWLEGQAITPRARVWLATFWNRAIHLSASIAEAVASISEEEINEIVTEHAQSRASATNGQAR